MNIQQKAILISLLGFIISIVAFTICQSKVILIILIANSITLGITSYIYFKN